jgi:hypothetical protein
LTTLTALVKSRAVFSTWVAIVLPIKVAWADITLLAEVSNVLRLDSLLDSIPIRIASVEET